MAVALSRNHLKMFFSQASEAARTPTDRPVGNSSAQLDVASLVPTVHQLFAAGMAPSTRRADKYTRFCARASQPLFPVVEETMMLFVSMLHREGLAPGTLMSYMAAVRFEQISRGAGST